MVDMEPDLTQGHPEDPEEVAHAQMVDLKLDLTWGHQEDSDKVTHVQLVSTELDLSLDKLNSLKKVTHMQHVSMEPDLLLGKLDCLEDYAHMHIEVMEPEVLMDTECDWLEEAEEAEEVETTEVIVAINEELDPFINLQGPGVSHLTMLEGTNAPTLPLPKSLHQPVLMRTKSLLRSLATRTGMQVTGEPSVSIDLKPLLLDPPPLNGTKEPPDSIVPEQIQAPNQVRRPLESFWGKKTQCATGQDSQTSAHVAY